MFNKKKAISPIIGSTLLLVVAIIASIAFQNWFQSFQSVGFNDVNNQATISDDVEIEEILGDNLYLNAGTKLVINSIEIGGIDCEISGTYSELSKIDISSCLELVTNPIVNVIITTEDSVISSTQYLIESESNSLLISSQTCFNSSNVNTIGLVSPCLDMLIVDRAMLDAAIIDGADKYITFSGTNYTFGDSTYNVFTGQVITMSQLFDHTVFNSNINYWDVSNVTSMYQTFYNADAFNQPLNNWDVSSVASMSAMFRNTRDFNQNIDSWNLSSANNIQSMFQETNSFNQPLNNWNIDQITDIRFMFEDANSFNQPLNNWNVSSVINMFATFRNTNSFNQNISLWDVDQVTTCTTFDTSAVAWIAENKPNFTSCTP
jgi:surface protein